MVSQRYPRNRRSARNIGRTSAPRLKHGSSLGYGREKSGRSHLKNVPGPIPGLRDEGSAGGGIRIRLQ